MRKSSTRRQFLASVSVAPVAMVASHCLVFPPTLAPMAVSMSN
ncbi:MAG: twin-arginine translocation signal domain-containing protein [Pirellula sp.]